MAFSSQGAQRQLYYIPLLSSDSGEAAHPDSSVNCHPLDIAPRNG